MIATNFEQVILNNQQTRIPGKLYRKARSRGWCQKVWSFVTGRSRRLLDFSALKDTHILRGSCYLGCKTVSLSEIGGSEGRTDDFDIDFYPLQNHTRDRWLNIARARLQGLQLPAVKLIQVGPNYYVRDGHHRISVARALGQEYIEASVTLWKMSETFPEEGLLASRVGHVTA